MVVLLLFLKISLLITCALSAKNETKCNNKFRAFNNTGNGLTAKINTTVFCENKPCIPKCCNGKNSIYYEIKNTSLLCLNIDVINAYLNNTHKLFKMDYSNIDIYNANIKERVIKTAKKIDKDFQLIFNQKFFKYSSSAPCQPNIRWANDKLTYRVLEDSSLIEDSINRYYRFKQQQWDMEDFCMELLVRKEADGQFTGPHLVYKLYTNKSTVVVSTDTNDQTYTGVGLLISSIFLYIVLMVYSFLSQLHSRLSGKVQMAYVLMLMLSFALKGIKVFLLKYGQIGTAACRPMTLFMYYTLLSTFFWMNTMSFDMWRNIRSIANSLHASRRKMQKKFKRYGLYAWGVPGLIALATGILDYIPLQHKPEIVQPNFGDCFFASVNVIETKLFLYIPIAILLLGNCLCFLLTTYNIWQVNRGMAKCNNNDQSTIIAKNRHQNSYFLILRLSILMGISWIFEVVKLPLWLERFADAYNSLLGVSIFFALVFKRDVFVHLCDRFHITHPLVEKWRKKKCINKPGLVRTETKSSNDTHSNRISDVSDGKGRKSLEVRVIEPTENK